MARGLGHFLILISKKSKKIAAPTARFPYFSRLRCVFSYFSRLRRVFPFFFSAPTARFFSRLRRIFPIFSRAYGAFSLFSRAFNTFFLFFRVPTAHFSARHNTTTIFLTPTALFPIFLIPVYLFEFHQRRISYFSTTNRNFLFEHIARRSYFLFFFRGRVFSYFGAFPFFFARLRRVFPIFFHTPSARFPFFSPNAYFPYFS